MPKNQPLHEAARHVRMALDGDACSIYVASGRRAPVDSTGATGPPPVPAYYFAGCDGASEDLPGPGPGLFSGPRTEPWLGLTSFVAEHGVPLRVDDLSGKTEVEIEYRGERRRIRIDRQSCELAEPGPFLAVPLLAESQVVGVVRVLRVAGREPFGDGDLDRLEGLAPFLTLATLQERERGQLVQSLLEIANSSSESDVLEAIAATALTLVGGDGNGAAVFLEDPMLRGEGPEDRVFTFRAPRQDRRSMKVKEYRPSDPGLTMHVVKTGGPVLSANLQRDLAPGGSLADVRHVSKGGELAEGKTRSFVAVPIFHPDDDRLVVGVIRVSAQRPHLFSQRDVVTLQAIADQTRRILQSLWGRDRLFQALVTTSNSPTVAIDKKGRITVFNRAMQELFGITEEEATTKNVVEVFYDGDLLRARETMNAIRSSDDGRLEQYHTVCFRRCKETGQRIAIPVSVEASLLRSSHESGKPARSEEIGSIGILKDLRGPHFQNHVTHVGNGFTVDPRVAEEVGKLAGLSPESRGTPIHIQGESGAGKEEFFREACKVLGEHREQRTLNCACLKGELLEGELFGSVAGAFTGAVDRAGIFDPKGPSMVLLDEVSETPLSCQAQLLRVLDRGVIRRVGKATEEEVDVQVVTATLDDLGELVEAGRFRKDLYYRLKGLVIRLLPLRERRADVMQLAEAFLLRAREESGADQPRGFASEVVEAFLAYDWPGNVRELLLAVSQAVAHHRREGGSGVLLELRHFPRTIQAALPRSADVPWLRKRVCELEAKLSASLQRTDRTSPPRPPAALPRKSPGEIVAHLREHEPERAAAIAAGGVEALKEELARQGVRLGKTRLYELLRELAPPKS